mgnify:FL=1
MLCGKIFLLGDDSNKQEDDDRFNKLQIKYNTQVKQYSLLETDMKNAKYQHGRLLTEAKTAEEKSKQNTRTQTNYYKKEKAAHATKKTRITELEKEIAALKKELKAIKYKESQLAAGQSGNEKQLTKLQDEIKRLKKEKSDLSDELKQCKQKKKEAQSEAKVSKAALSTAKEEMVAKVKTIEAKVKTIEARDDEIVELKKKLVKIF